MLTLPAAIPLPATSSARGKRSSNRTSAPVLASAIMDRRKALVAKLPPLAHRDLMLELMETMETRLGGQLLPSTVPADVLEFSNRAGTALGSLDIRQGAPGSSIDFILESFLHSKLPNGALLDISSVLAFLNGSTDAPHFLLELIQGSPTSLVVLLDQLPRKDLALYPDYIDKFYQNTQLDTLRQELEKLPRVLPYRSSSLYVRSVLSPTAVAVNINCGGDDGQVALEEMTRAQLADVAKEVLGIWLDNYSAGSAQMEQHEMDTMLKRDSIVKSKSVEIDLSANLPRLFDAEVLDPVFVEIKKAFRVQDGEHD